jgi:prolyl-tRNA synthetase
MPDGRALQLCTTHVLAHSFPESFDVKFQSNDGSMQVPFCTSWGLTTRTIGALVMVHGDQNGLIIPPKLAPIQIVIIPIYKSDSEKKLVFEKAEEIKKTLLSNEFSVFFDSNEQESPGSKFYAWELKGVPIRLEIGPKDIEKQQIVLVNRAEEDRAKKKIQVPFIQIAQAVNDLLKLIHTQLYSKAESYMRLQKHQADKLQDFATKLDEKNGFYQAGWCGRGECEVTLKAYKGTIRCLIKENQHSICFNCNNSSKTDVLIAKAY